MAFSPPPPAEDPLGPFTGAEVLEESSGPDVLQRIAAAADLCLAPQRYGVRLADPEAGAAGPLSLEEDLCLLLEARDPEGQRLQAQDLELEIYRSGTELNLMLSRLGDDQAPLLWQGQHPVWMEASSGARCERPADGAPLEALARRLRALVVGD